MKLFLFSILIFAFSCAENDLSKIKDLEDSGNVAELDGFIITENSDWVCYHPETVFHNKRCIEKNYPEGCYVSGDRSKFCWLLQRSECSDPINLDVLTSCINLGYLKR